MGPENKTCQSCKQSFIIEPDDFGFYESIKVPPPTWCPECRLKRRLAWNGYRMLYKRKCDYTGDTVISALHPDVPRKVYRQDVWWSDKWDPLSYGREYDFSKPFFEQFKELFEAVPMPSLYTEYTTMVDSDHCNAAATLKNSYLCFKSDTSEDCAYTNTMEGSKSCFDVSYLNGCELSYESVNIDRCYKAFYSVSCEDCHDIYFSEDLVGCSNCIGCVGLRNKNYHIFNQPYSKEGYEAELGKLEIGSWTKREELRKKSTEFISKGIHKYFRNRNTVSSSGDYLNNCKNVKNSFMVKNGENIRFSQLLKNGPAANCYDYTMFAMGAEWIYESAWVGISVNNIKFGLWDYHAHDLEYCFGCHGSGNLFGCVGVRSAEYCILNKRYSKEEYFDLVGKIKKQMSELPYKDRLGREYRYGEYFPVELSPWRYNETNIYEWFPIAKEKALAEGYAWRDPDQKEYQPATIEVSDSIKDAKDDILKEILKCVDCGRNYQIIPMELDFYRRFDIPIPRHCPLCRDRARIQRLNPMEIYKRTCAKCGKQIETSYAPDRPEVVYCESCYNSEVA